MFKLHIRLAVIRGLVEGAKFLLDKDPARAKKVLVITEQKLSEIINDVIATEIK